MPHAQPAHIGRTEPPGSDWTNFDEVEAALDDVHRTMERHPERARQAARRLVTLLTPPPARDSANARGGLAPWQERKVDQYVIDHLEHPVLIRDLAEQIPLSVSHFCRAFKESFGTTPHVHITRRRLQLAQRLMLTTEQPLARIAPTCGLGDQAHLSKLFRRHVGETPSSWRRRQRSMAEPKREAAA
jgi:AraC family transcriptional regulator